MSIVITTYLGVTQSKVNERELLKVKNEGIYTTYRASEGKRLNIKVSNEY